MDIFEKPFTVLPLLTTGHGCAVVHTDLSLADAFIIDILGRGSALERMLYNAGNVLGLTPGAAVHWQHIRMRDYSGSTPVAEVLDFNGIITATAVGMSRTYLAAPHVLKLPGRKRVSVNQELTVDPTLFRQYLLFYTGYWDTAILRS